MQLFIANGEVLTWEAIASYIAVCLKRVVLTSCILLASLANPSRCHFNRGKVFCWLQRKESDPNYRSDIAVARFSRACSYGGSTRDEIFFVLFKDCDVE